LPAVELTARGEAFRIVQLQGHLLVCARQHGSCGCGWDEKGRMPFDPHELWGAKWERRRIRNRVHFTYTGCLGPCAVGNNALLLLYGRSIWLKDLNQPEVCSTVFDWIESMLTVGHVLPPPDRLECYVYERFIGTPASDGEPLTLLTPEVADGLDWLDPVCLMEVDPATGSHTLDFEGRTIAFCAPACKKQFVADPSAYLITG
jgi:cobaltochelatase CobN